MTSLTRFLKSGQLVHLLGNPAVANPPTNIKVRTVEGNVGSIVKSLVKRDDNFSSNSPTVVHSNKSQNEDFNNTKLPGESDLTFALRRAAKTTELGKSGAYGTTETPNPKTPEPSPTPHNTPTQNAS